MSEQLDIVARNGCKSNRALISSRFALRLVAQPHLNPGGNTFKHEQSLAINVKEGSSSIATPDITGLEVSRSGHALDGGTNIDMLAQSHQGLQHNDYRDARSDEKLNDLQQLEEFIRASRAIIVLCET